MIRLDYLQRGLFGLARACQATPLAGHLGAAVIAGYLVTNSGPDFEPGVSGAIEKELDRIMAGEESVWFDPKKTHISVAELFEPFESQWPGGESTRGIAEALAGNIDRLRQSGHNAIFAAIGLRALHDHPELAIRPVVTGIRQLVEAFHDAGPGRGYYGKQQGWIPGDRVPLPEKGPAPYGSVQEMIDTVIDELIDGAAMHRRGFGGLFHLINHAAALAELSRCGYADLAQKGLVAHHQHLLLWKSLPDLSKELGPLERATHDPRTRRYWQRSRSVQWSAWLTHRIKTLYGFWTIAHRVADHSKRERAARSLLYLMA